VIHSMHIPDGFLAPQVALGLWVVMLVTLALALRQIRTTQSSATRPVLMGISGAFIFAAQMFNFPVAAGTSGHLLGGVLAAVLLGPWAGAVVMTTVIGIQALLFQDGGLLALGANVINMGVIGTLAGGGVARGISVTLGGSTRATIIGAGVAGWLSVMAGAGIATLELGLSGTTNVAIGLPAMLGTHALIGIGEALITVAALSFIATSAPDLLASKAQSTTPGDAATQSASPLRRVAIGASIVLLTGGLASLFASTSPDGLTKVATDLGFIGATTRPPFELFVGYTIPGLDGAAARLVAVGIGAAAVALALLIITRIAGRNRRGGQ